MATAGISNIFITMGVSALTGMATSSALSLASSIVVGELNWKQYFIDSGIGAITGIASAAQGKVVGGMGKSISNALGYMKFGKKTVNTVMGFNTFVSGIAKFTEIAGGVASGIYFDKVVNRAFNRQDTLVERVKDNFLSLSYSLFFELIGYIW